MGDDCVCQHITEAQRVGCRGARAPGREKQKAATAVLVLFLKFSVPKRNIEQPRSQQKRRVGFGGSSCLRPGFVLCALGVFPVPAPPATSRHPLTPMWAMTLAPPLPPSHSLPGPGLLGCLRGVTPNDDLSRGAKNSA